MKVIILLLLAVTQAAVMGQPIISFTFDDGSIDDMAGYPFERWNKMLLDNLDDGGVRTIFFVMGNNKTSDSGKSLLQSWGSRGHRIANHTYTHPNYGSKGITYEKFALEFLKTDSLIRQYPGYISMFRFPYLKEGDTREKVDAFRQLLAKYRYRNGHVTIDGSDWYINSRLLKRLRKSPGDDMEKFKQYYLDHLFERATYYEGLAYKLTGRHMSHTLLLHHNLAAALFVDDLIVMFRQKGWKIISAEEAYRDPIFERYPTNLPGGESLIWALAKESGKFERVLRYPAEDASYEEALMDSLGL